MGSAKRILARSDNYIVSHRYETVVLERPARLPVVIGDHYGDPVAAVIDWDEKWCITVGCGLVLYWLREPFWDYEYHRNTSQWYELHRYPPEEWWIETIYQVDNDTVRFVTDPWGDNPGLYELRTENPPIIKLIARLVPDDEGV
jgi:hypothetical protein